VVLGRGTAPVNVVNVLHADDDLRLGDFSHACSLPESDLPGVEFEDTDNLRLYTVYRTNPDINRAIRLSLLTSKVLYS